MAKPGRPRAYEMYVSRKPGPFPKQWKVTARYSVHTKRGVVPCVRLHGFPGDEVVHLDEATLTAWFKKEAA